MILEALSIGLIFPVIMIFINDTLQEYVFDNFLKNFDNQILIWLVFTIVFLYFFKNIFLLFYKHGNTFLQIT